MPKDEWSVHDSDGSVQIINTTDLDTDVVMAEARQHPEIAALTKWTHDVQGGGSPERRHGTLFERDRYVTPGTVFEQIALARAAAEDDDIVSSVLESTEALTFSKMAIEADDEDQEDIYNQIAADLDLDSRLREIFREVFMVSQAYVAVWWGRKTYKVSGKSQKGVARKKTYDNLVVPLGLSILDPLKVIPVGSFLFNQEQLVYIADRTEADAIDSYLLGRQDSGSDLIIGQLITGKYEADIRERKQLGNYGVDATFLYTMNPKNVFRHTATRSQYQRFASVRMKSVFEILDLKHQLRQTDRAHLLGASNFLLIIKKGTDNLPAQPEEIANLQNQVRSVARLPVIVGDHRLSVEIVTPSLDMTLEPTRYAGLDTRIAGRLFGNLIVSSGPTRGDDSIKVARVIARGLESRRHMQRRALEKYVLMPTYEANDAFTEVPKLRFYPKRIALDFDPALASFLLDLFDGGNLSRDSVLSEVDYDEDDEARKRQIEKEKYDDIFMPTILPAGSPGLSNPGQVKEDPKNAGRTKGGTRSGGGAAPGTGQGQNPRNPRRRSDGNGRSSPDTAELHEEED